MVTGNHGSFGTASVTISWASPLPTRTAQCMHGGWKTFTDINDKPVFKSQADCIRFVNTGGKSMPGRCAGVPVTIRGSASADRLVGTPKRNVILGGRGNDRISAGGGSDLVCGGAGHDRVLGGQGNDHLFGGPGNDVIFGGPGNDRIDPGPGRDHVFAGPGNDRIFARDGQRDVIDCGPGHDVAIVDRVDVTRRCEVVIRARRRLRPPRAGLG